MGPYVPHPLPSLRGGGRSRGSAGCSPSEITQPTPRDASSVDQAGRSAVRRLPADQLPV